MARRPNKLIPDDFPTHPGLDAGPDLVAVGAGRDDELDTARVRDLAAAFARSTSRRARITLTLTDPGAVTSADAAREVTEGAVTARYRYTALQTAPKDTPLAARGVTIADTDGSGVDDAIAAGLVAARTTIVARDLTNTPPGQVTAADLGGVAEVLGAECDFSVELFSKEALIALGCGGLLAVNQGSVEEPRMVKVRITVKSASDRCDFENVASRNGQDNVNAIAGQVTQIISSLRSSRASSHETAQAARARGCSAVQNIG